MEEVEFVTLEWVDWFNNRRLLNPLEIFPQKNTKCCIIVVLKIRLK